MLAVVLRTNDNSPWTDEFDSKSNRGEALQGGALGVNGVTLLSPSRRDRAVVSDRVHFDNQPQDRVEEDHKRGAELRVLRKEDLR